MATIKVPVHLDLEVDTNAAAKLMSEFVEWMEEHDFKITIPKAGKWGNDNGDWTWDDLARAYVAEREVNDGGV